jgi:hypothetical protein
MTSILFLGGEFEGVCLGSAGKVGDYSARDGFSYLHSKTSEIERAAKIFF